MQAYTQLQDALSSKPCWASLHEKTLPATSLGQKNKQKNTMHSKWQDDKNTVASQHQLQSKKRIKN